MFLTHVIRLALIVAIFVAVLHSVATVFFFYSFIWWFDIPMHFFGGFCAGLVSLYFYACFHRRRERTMTPLRVWVTAVGGVLAVGLVWELFEYSTGITSNALGNYALDTVKDLVMDLLGGFVACVYFIKRGIHNKL